MIKTQWPRNCKGALSSFRLWATLTILLTMRAGEVFGLQNFFSETPVWLPLGQSSSYALVAGDVDVDGDLDLVIGDYDGTRLYLNTEEGFPVAPVWEVGGACWGVVLGDVDGDGDLDMVRTSGNVLALHLNDGGAFADTPSWFVDLAADTTCRLGDMLISRLALGDVDGDGDLDLVCAIENEEVGSGPVMLYLNIGGKFTDKADWTFCPGTYVFCIALGDVNKDNRLDLVCGGENTDLLLNDGGTLQTLPTWSGPGSGSVALGDIDGDGDMDLICGGTGFTVRLYSNVNGDFGAVPAWMDTLSDGVCGVALGDVDGDSDLDLIVGGCGDASVLYLNQEGALSSSPVWSFEQARSVNTLSLADFSGDGGLDVAFAGSGERDLLYLNSTGPFSTTPIWSAEAPTATVSVDVGDVNGDGDLDLICGNGGDRSYQNTVYLHENGRFSTRPTWIFPALDNTYGAAIRDINGDNRPDVIFGNFYQQTCAYINQGGEMPFPLVNWVSNPRDGTACIALGDVDGDNDLDLVCGTGYGGGSTLYKSDGATFSTAPDWRSNEDEDMWAVALGDVDLDGDLDLILNGSTTVLYTNNGALFSEEPTWRPRLKNFSFARGVALADVDGDNYPDLACGTGCSVVLYKNMSGTFSDRPVWSGVSCTFGPHPERLAFEDVDADGDPDLICGNGTGSSLESNTVYLNHGGSLSEVPDWSAEPTRVTRDIALKDVDEDGDLDLICGNWEQANTMYDGLMNPAYKGDPNSPANQLPNNPAFIESVEVQSVDKQLCRLLLTLVDVESDPVYLVLEYQYYGVAEWHGVDVVGHSARVGPFRTSPAGQSVSLMWDTHLLPFDKRDVILRIRTIESPRRVGLIQHLPSFLYRVGPVTPYRPVISAPDMMTFPAVTFGDTTSAQLILSNVGTAPLTITNIGLPTHDMRVAGAFPMSVAPKGRAELMVIFTPSSDTDVQGSATLETDDPFSPSLIVDMTADVRALDFALANLYPSGEIPQGLALGISVVMQDSVHADSARVFYREGGKATLEVMRLQRIDNPVNEQYYGSVHTESITARGVEYFIEVYNDRFKKSGELGRLRTRVRNLEFASLPPAGRYTMISLPLEMQGPILGTLADDIGGADVTKWRLFARDVTRGVYVELPNDTVSSFEQGRGYWLVTKDSHPLDTGPAEGLSTPTDTAFAIDLKPGWNMVGDPFDFPVAWDSVTVNGRSMTEAESTVVNPPVGWTDNHYEYDLRILEPWEGYWVKNLGDTRVVLRIAPREAVGGVSTTRPMDVVRENKSAETDDNWTIVVVATSEEAKDEHNYLGVKIGARSEWDRFDRSEAPMSPGDGIALYFPHAEWGTHPDCYTVDIREDYQVTETNPSSSGAGTDKTWGHRWSFDVAKNFSKGTAGDEVVLEFSGMEAIPTEAEVLLIDRQLDRLVDLREGNRYAFFQGKKEFVTSDEDTRFVLLVGSEEFVNSYGDDLPGLPTQTVLHQNHPNPFNPSTLIRYELAQPGHVTLRIYDVSGALVKVLEDRDRAPGRYEIGWDANDDRGNQVSSGVYFYQLKTPGFSQTRKMVILK